MKSDTITLMMINAAPDMVRALREMVAYFESDIEGFEEDDPKFVAFQKARAALAKAGVRT